jgi:putative flavoprotein involved in K+ transport
MDWFMECKFMDERTGSVSDPKILSMKMALISGIGEGGHTISLQYLAQKGVILVGKMEKADGVNLFFQRNTIEHIRFADDYSNAMKGMIDEYILNNRIQATDHELDYADLPDTMGEYSSAISSLNLDEHHITSIIWATGQDGQFNYIKLPILNRQGRPKHQCGITEIEGLYFLAGPWLRSRKSNLILGIKDDAAFICNKIYSSLR